MKLKVLLFVGMLALGGTADLAQADINMTSGTIAGDDDILTGTILTANYFTVNNPSASALTINGVAFSAINGTVSGTGAALSGLSYSGSNGLSFTFNGFGGSTMTGDDGLAVAGTNTAWWNGLSSDYQTLLSSGFYAGDGSTAPGAMGNGSFQMTLSGLTVGQQYIIRFFSSNGAHGSYIQMFSSVTASAFGNGGSANTGNDGSYFTTTLTADDTSRVFTFAGLGGPAILDGIEILQVGVVPEPSTVALLSAGACLIGLTAVRRFRAVRA